jgi:superfamily II DNA or RNA helicase
MPERRDDSVKPNQRVYVYGREDLGVGEVLRICESGESFQADVAFDDAEGRQLHTFPLDRLQSARDPWQRIMASDLDSPLDFLLKQLALQLPLANTGGELSNSRTALLPHQILLTRDVIAATRRRLLIADEVGLGKTIETGMVIRELVARGDADRILIICPAGLTKNWQNELRDCFRLHFDILGSDFIDANPSVWESHRRVIASIDRLKMPQRIQRLLASPKWDLVAIDEAHHVSRVRYGNKVAVTQNYKLAEALRGHTRDFIFLSATPHQGDAFQFWSLVQVLDDSLFESPEAMLDHRGLLNRVMVRRTKRDVTDAHGKPIFMRRQVHTQTFPLAARERAFYDRLTEYLREGYGVAGLGEKRTTSRQRAVGFVMATFQKIMSSSPRAIRQALRRRLMVLLARQQMALEAQRERGRADVAEKIVGTQEELRDLAIAVHQLPPSPSQRAEADSLVARLKQQLARNATEETTQWSLDDDEEADEGISAEADIPYEAPRVRELISLVPEGTDRKFETLVRAIEQVRREYVKEKFLIFTQYRETLEYLREELGKLHGASKIATIKGGPLEDKIAAVESFWDPEGAQFLVSTSAGGEGINLQVCHIVFNYDLPWNPMAVEQRIGRIHRYGQRDTAQVYNLVAEDTVEERIYGLIEQKLLDIAQTIGRIDPVTGQVTEDFRSEILGFLGSSPNYQDLYKKALVDKDYRRTEREITEAVERARQASEALRNLTQGLDAFNLEDYRQLQGHYTLDDLKAVFTAGILRLGGAVLPDGELLRVEVPECLRSTATLSARYENVTFDRALAMRTRKAQFFGLGHPLIDALIKYLRSPRFRGEATVLPGAKGEGRWSVRFLVKAEMEGNRQHVAYEHFLVDLDGAWEEAPPRADIEALQAVRVMSGSPLDPHGFERIADVRERVAQGERELQARLRSGLDGVLSVRTLVVGVAQAPSARRGDT